MDAIRNDILLRKVMSGYLIVGIYPLKVSDNMLINRLYIITRHLLVAYIGAFIFSMFVEIGIGGSDMGVMILFDNLSVSFLYVPTFVKVLKITGNKMMLLVTQIRETENLIFNSQDECLIKIFKYHTRVCYNVCNFIYIVAVITILPFYLNPLVRSVEVVGQDGNITLKGALPFSAWYPFDKYKYYYSTMVLQIVTGVFSCSYTVIADTTFWSSTIFAILLIKILHHKLVNFKQYSLSIQNSYGGIDAYQAQLIHLKICVALHRTIKKFVYDLNAIINTIMLLDFLLCSVQMAVCGIRIFMSDESGVAVIFAIEFLAAMLAQMFLSYWFANELICESSAIPAAIWDSDWIEFPQDIQRSLFFIALNARTPLTLNVGPFYAMSTDVAISIVKAAYSCITVIRQTYGHGKK